MELKQHLLKMLEPYQSLNANNLTLYKSNVFCICAPHNYHEVITCKYKRLLEKVKELYIKLIALDKFNGCYNSEYVWKNSVNNAIDNLSNFKDNYNNYAIKAIIQTQNDSCMFTIGEFNEFPVESHPICLESTGGKTSANQMESKLVANTDLNNLKFVKDIH